MSKKEFESFLEKYKEGKIIDWSQRKQEWLANIEQFYQTIQKWLKQYSDKGKVTIGFQRIALNEDYIGRYQTNQLHLKVANKEIVFTPRGINFIGGGRIDMESRAEKVQFILVGKNSPKKWKIAAPLPSTKYIELNEENFFNVLMEAINR